LEWAEAARGTAARHVARRAMGKAATQSPSVRSREPPAVAAAEEVVMVAAVARARAAAVVGVMASAGPVEEEEEAVAAVAAVGALQAIAKPATATSIHERH